METESASLLDLLGMILFLGSFTFLLGAFFQIYILYSRKATVFKSIGVVLITRIITFSFAVVIWANWIFSFDVMFSFVFLPALIPELIFSPLILKIAGGKTKNSQQMTEKMERS